MVEIHDAPSTSTIDGPTARRNQLVDEWLDARRAAEKYGAIAKEIAEELVRELGVGGRHEVVPGVGARVQAPAMSFDAERAREILTPDQYASICESKPSAKLATRVLPGVLVDQCKLPAAAPTVREL